MDNKSIISTLFGIGLLSLLCLYPVVLAQTETDANRDTDNVIELNHDMPSKLQVRIEYQEGKYQIGPGDILAVKVLHEPEYNQEDILVRPDGLASFLGAGEIQVANESVETVSKMIETSLSDILVNPKVMLTVKTIRPQPVYLSGAVVHPGMFQFTTNANGQNFSIKAEDTLVRTDMRLTNVLANAGGVKMTGDIGNISIKRSNTGEITHVNLWQVLKDGDVNEDVWINAGDHIAVPELGSTGMTDEEYQTLLSSSIGPREIPIRVIGEVIQAGLVSLDGTSPYLNTALAKAGGFAPGANKKQVAIRRFTAEKDFTTLFVDLNKEDILLQPNDVVFVSESRLYKLGRFTSEAFKMLSPFNSAAVAASGVSQTFGLGGWRNFRRF